MTIRNRKEAENAIKFVQVELSPIEALVRKAFFDGKSPKSVRERLSGLGCGILGIPFEPENDEFFTLGKEYRERAIEWIVKSNTGGRLKAEESEFCKSLSEADRELFRKWKTAPEEAVPPLLAKAEYARILESHGIDPERLRFTAPDGDGTEQARYGWDG